MARTGSKQLAFVLLAVVLSSCKSCKKDEAGAADAGALSSIVTEEELGFTMELTPDWSMGQVDKSTGKLADARRLPPRGRTFMVAPRLVVSAEPTDEKDARAVIQAAQNDLRSFGEKRGVAVERMAMSTRRAGSFEVGDVELAYQVKLGDRKSEVVQRSIMTRVPKQDGSAVALTITVTYMTDDAELIAPEVHRILSSLRLAEERK
jgi:hypothetical protein